MDEDIKLRVSCATLAAACFVSGAKEYNVHEIVAWAEILHKFCVGQPIADQNTSSDGIPF